MATRKPNNPELAAAADNLAAAIQHVRVAVSKKVEAIRAAASVELAKGSRLLEDELKKVEAKLSKASEDAKKSVHQVVRQAESKLQAAVRTAGKKAPAKKAPAKKAAAKKAPAKKAAAKKAAGRAA